MLNKQKGFTLLEILIAMFIFTIISVIMVSAMRIVFNTQSGTEKSAARLSELQVTFTLMTRDFEQTIDRPITNMSGAEENAFVGTHNSVIFSHAGLANPLGQFQQSTLQRVGYKLQKNNLVRETWSALDQTHHTQSSQRTILNGVNSIEFQFLDKNNAFQNRWPPGNQGNHGELPRAVRVTIILKDLGKMSQLYVIPGQKIENGQ